MDLALNGLMASVYRLWPDVLLVVSGLFVDDKMLDCIRSRGTRVVIIHTESPYEDQRQIDLAAHADLNLVNDPTHLESFRAVAPTWYVPHAYCPDRHHPRPPDPALACDFAFVGTGYPSRISFLEQVDWSGLDVRLGGNWVGLDEDSPLRRYMVGDVGYCLPNDEAVDLYASCGMSANLYRREADRPDLVQGWAMSPREVELAAMGVAFLREPRGEGDEVLSCLPTFESPGEFTEKLRWYLANERVRASLAQKIREAVADRTFESNARRLLSLLGSLVPAS